MPDAVLNRIYARLQTSTVSYSPADDEGWKYGADAQYLAEFRTYWLGQYDWRKEESKLNEFPQFLAEIDGLCIHFHHVIGSGASPFPLLLTHGWPGSTVEFLGVVHDLAARGYSLVIPSLPGYGFSPRPPRPLGPQRVAAIWRALMTDVLGYRRFGAQGGDWGAWVTRALGQQHSDVVAAIHLNMIYPEPDIGKHPELREWQEQISGLMYREGAYHDLHREKPQTIGLALSDTPLGFAAWVLEKNHGWRDTRADMDATFGRDKLITNIMTYLVNDAVTSAIWMYRGFFEEKMDWARVEIPTGFAEFPAEFLPPPPRAVVEREFNLVRCTRMERGGHFAAWEQPSLFAEEVGSFFTEWR